VNTSATSWPTHPPGSKTSSRMSRPLLRRSGLRPRHRPGPTAERRAPQLAPGPTEAIPQTRTIDGLLRLRWRTSSPSAAWPCPLTRPNGSPPGGASAASTPSPNHSGRPWPPSTPPGCGLRTGPAGPEPAPAATTPWKPH
jgi:hypothetical protein